MQISRFERFRLYSLNHPWLVAGLAYAAVIAHIRFLPILPFWSVFISCILSGFLVRKRWVSANVFLGLLVASLWVFAVTYIRFPYAVWLVQLVAFVPMIYLIERVEKRLNLLLYGLWTGVVLYSAAAPSVWSAISSFWRSPVPGVSYLVFLLLTLFLGVQFGLVMVITGHLRHRMRAGQTAWLFLLVYLVVESWMPFPFPNEPGFMIVRAPILIQISDLLGSETITMICVLVAAALFSLIYPGIRSTLTRRLRWILVALLILAPLFQLTYGAIMMHRMAPSPDAESIDLALIQPCSPLHILNKDHEQKVIVAQNLIDLSLEVIRSQDTEPDILFWPEGAGAIHYLEPHIPFEQAFNPEYLLAIRDLQRQTSTTLAITDLQFIRPPEGVPFVGEAVRYRYLNHVSLIGPDGRLQGSFVKVIRLPFAEYLPFEEMLLRHKDKALARFLHRILRSVFPDVRAVGGGYDRVVLYGPKAAFAPLICYEAIFKSHVRNYVGEGAQYLVNLANEGWLGSTWIRELSMQVAILRSVENRVPLVRVTNSGISSISDARGVVQQRANDQEVAFLRGPLVPGPGASLYSRGGYLFARTVLSPLLALLVLIAMFRNRKHAKAGSPAIPLEKTRKRKNTK